MTLFDDIAQQTGKLTHEEQLQLIMFLDRQAQQSMPETRVHRHWYEIRGAAAYPLVREDAQTWITRQRQANDDSRAQQWESES